MPTACQTSDAYRQRPAICPLEFVQGDELPFTLKINRDLTGHTLSAGIVCVETGLPVCAFAISPTYETIAGQVYTRAALLLTEQQTALIVPPLTYRWAFSWVTPAGRTQTIIAGRVTAAKR